MDLTFSSILAWGTATSTAIMKLLHANNKQFSQLNRRLGDALRKEKLTWQPRVFRHPMNAVSFQGEPLNLYHYQLHVSHIYPNAVHLIVINFLLQDRYISPTLRDEMICWLIKLTDKYNFHPETLALSVAIFDHFLSLVKVSCHTDLSKGTELSLNVQYHCTDFRSGGSLFQVM